MLRRIYTGANLLLTKGLQIALLISRFIKRLFPWNSKAIDSEVEYRNSDEAIAEELTEGENDFTENGKMY
jgi:hypothetical protein